KKCNGGCPLANPPACRTPQNAKAFGIRMGQPRFSCWAPPSRAPLQIVTLPLEGEVEAATKHAEIIFRPVDHAEAQVVSPTEVPRDSEFETGSELAENFGLGTEVIRLRIDSEGIRRSLCVNDIPFATVEDRAHTSPGVRRKTCARNRIAQRKRS